MSDLDPSAPIEHSSDEIPGGNQSESASSSADTTKPKRVMSTIEFPYNDLASSLEVAQILHQQVGRSITTPDKVAAWLGSTVTSGTFKLRMSAARMFGLITGERGSVRLTELGARTLDPETTASAKAAAFMSVPLYKRLHDDNRGRLLPKAAGLEAEMVAVGVSPNQREKARQVFERSARQAGFFAHGDDRLVEPTFKGGELSGMIPEVPEPDPKPAGREVKPRQSEVSAVADDPLVQGLLNRMPPPEKGWPASERARWLQTFAMNLTIIYGLDEEEDDQPSSGPPRGN